MAVLTYSFLFFSFLLTIGSQSFALEISELNLSKERCTEQDSTDKILYQDRFRWGLTREDMADLFDETYRSGERLEQRAFLKGQSIILPHNTSGTPKTVTITSEFIQNLTRRIEETLTRGYADFVFFPDMGHSHFYFKQDHWDSIYEPYLKDLPVSRFNELYEKMMADPALYSLFHTAEQLLMVDENKNLLDDPYIRFRWWHRNPTLPNNPHDDLRLPTNPKQSFNTVNGIHGFDGWSAGFYIHSSYNGCFPYKTPKGETLYFDISLHSLGMRPGSGSTNDWTLKYFDGIHWNSRPFYQWGPQKLDLESFR